MAAVLLLGATAGAQSPPVWRYDLQPGDHLMYRYSYQRTFQSNDERSQVEARFRTHVLVAAATGGRISIGFQRNRESADLTEYVSKGKDRLARELPEFRQRMKSRPTRFSEAMEISQDGEALEPWEVARESSIRLINALHEVMTLPPASTSKGGVWRGNAGMEVRWVDDESLHGKLCHHFETWLAEHSLQLSYWWSPESGVLEEVALDETYMDYDTTTHETARMELESRTRGEAMENWLTAVDTRLGALEAILLDGEVPVSIAQLRPIFDSDDRAGQARALAIAARRKIAVPADTLPRSASDEVRTLAGQAVGLQEPQPATDDCHRALLVRPSAARVGTFLQAVPATKDGPEIPYILRVPLSYSNRSEQPSPLLVVLSGGSGRAMDGVNTASEAVSETDYVVLYPQAGEYWWKPEAARRFDVVLSDVLQRYNVDRDRVYITGFSNGGTGAVYFATLWPQRFAAVVSLMGAGQCNGQIKAGLPNLKNLPLLFVHGEDDPMIAANCSTTTEAALMELNPAVKPEMKLLPKRGHDITLQSDDGLALAFFKNKLRNPFPRQVEVIDTGGNRGRGYWVEILDGTPGKADVDARVKNDNTIDIHSHEVRSIRLHLRRELLPQPGELRIVWNGKKMFGGPLRDYCSLAITPETGDWKLDLSDIRDLALH